MLSTFVLDKEYNAAKVNITTHPTRPNNVLMRWFRRGEIIAGEIKHVKNEPAVVITPSGWIFPISVLKQVVSKGVSSNASGSDDSSSADGGDKKPNMIKDNLKTPAKTIKVQYSDAFLLGGAIGLGLGYLIERKFPQVQIFQDKKMKFYTAGVFAILGLYGVWRRNENNKQKSKKE